MKSTLFCAGDMGRQKKQSFAKVSETQKHNETQKHYIFLDRTPQENHQANYYRISEDSFGDAPITQDLWLTLL